MFETKVKICGLRRREDIEIVNIHLPDYAGFVFAESKRKVTPELAKELSGMLDKRVKSVGVFVNEKPETVLDISIECDLDVVQLHGDETPAFIKELKKNKIQSAIWKGIRVQDSRSIRSIQDYNIDEPNVEAFVLDAFAEGVYGGTGSTFDWKLAREAGKFGRIILAGGLNVHNLREAIAAVRPYAVDVSSGVESCGYKDESKIRDFICTARGWNIY